MAKAISECEALLTNKEAELAALKEEARKLESYDPAVEHGKELDGTVSVAFPCPLFMCAECQT
jgi:kinetochore protein Spc24